MSSASLSEASSTTNWAISVESSLSTPIACAEIPGFSICYGDLVVNIVRIVTKILHPESQKHALTGTQRGTPDVKCFPYPVDCDTFNKLSDTRFGRPISIADLVSGTRSSLDQLVVSLKSDTVWWQLDAVW